MKKILSIVLSLAAATVLLIGTAFAGDTVLLEETNGEVTDAINAAPEGAMIICTVKYDPDNANNGTTGGNGWGIGGVVTDGSWTVGSDYQAVYNSEGDFSLEPGEVREFTFDVDSIKRDATGPIQINFYNGWILQKAILRTVDGVAVDAGDAGDADGADGAVKTADTTTIVLFGVIAVMALIAVVAAKKARA